MIVNVDNFRRTRASARSCVELEQKAFPKKKIRCMIRNNTEDELYYQFNRL